MLLERLREIVGDRHVREDPQSLREYGCDRTTLWAPAPRCVVLPGSTAEVREVVLLARELGLPLVPSGGRTGLSGGAVAAHGEIVLNLQRMDAVLGFDPAERTVQVQAGMLTRRVQEYASERGLFYPVDFASAGSSQIGGNIATNAGGIKVIRYGMTRDQVRGLRVVDGNGALLDLNRGLVKNNAGPDLRHLFIGSEGILGVICEATLALRAAPAESTVMLLGAPDPDAVLGLLGCFSAALELSAFEFFDERALARVIERHGGIAPFAQPAPLNVLLEFDLEHADAALGLFETCLREGLALDGVLSQSHAQARALWSLRENISEALAPHAPWKNDISVGVARLPEFVRRAGALVAERYAGMEVIWYGHIGDGNLHLNILRPAGMDARDFAARCHDASHAIAALVEEFGGSISAEHGIGLLKRDYLHYTRGPAEIAHLRALKAVFDPRGIMNPGKVLAPAPPVNSD